MKARLVLLLAAAAMMVPAATAPAQTRTPVQRDWTRTVVQTPEGGFRMGNPDARVKVIEYLSLTCPHCAEFAQDGTPALVRDYVRSGRVSLEYRNYVLNGIDVTATLLARCSGPANFFRVTERLYATQPQWVGRIQGIGQEQRDQLSALAAGERLARLAAIGGLDTIVAEHGVSAQQGRRCLADEAALNRLGEMVQAAAALGVTGTPTFLINGVMVQANSWPALEPLIRQAGG